MPNHWTKKRKPYLDMHLNILNHAYHSILRTLILILLSYYFQNSEDNRRTKPQIITKSAAN